MYKIRVRQWGLSKYHRADEVLEMLRKKRQRDAIGKKTEFLLRGSVVDWESVERYIKRGRAVTAKIAAGQLEIGDSAPGLLCRTPPPDPARAFSVPGVQHASDEQRAVQEVVHIVRSYCQRTTEMSNQNHWGVGGDAAIDSLFNQMWEVACHILSNQVEAGFRTLNACHNRLTELIRQEHAHLLFWLAKLMADILESPHPHSLANTLSRYVLHLGEVTFGKGHPVCVLWGHLSRSLYSGQLDLQIRAAESMLDFLPNSDPEGHASSFRTIIDYHSRLLSKSGSTESLERAADAEQALILRQSASSTRTN